MSAASTLVESWCNRLFARAVLDELYTVGPNQSLLLHQFPVNAIQRLATSPTAVLSIANTDTATNQRAVAALAATGSESAGLVVTGLILTRWASGSAIASAVSFTSNETVAAVAAAVNALGGGWAASTPPGYASWPAADLRAPMGSTPALGGQGARFLAHVADLAFDLDADTGIVALGQPAGNAIASPAWGPTWSTSLGDLALYGGANGVRCVYDAGFDVVPYDVQQATAELVKAMLERLATDSTLLAESDGTYSWQGRGILDALPPSVKQTLALYRVTRA